MHRMLNKLISLSGKYLIILAVLVTLLSGIRVSKWNTLWVGGEGRGFPWLYWRVVTSTDVRTIPIDNPEKGGYVISDADKIGALVIGSISLVCDIAFWFLVLIILKTLLGGTFIVSIKKIPIPIYFLILIALFAFYWLNLRPAITVRKCYEPARKYCEQIEKEINPEGRKIYVKDERITNCYITEQWNIYKKCLTEEGISEKLAAFNDQCRFGWNNCIFFYDLPLFLLQNFIGRILAPIFSLFGQINTF